MSNPGTTNLISYYELEETSGTRVDSHGGNNLADGNTVTSTTGIQGTAAYFTAANSEHLDITDASQTGLDLGAGGSDFAISQWVKFNSLPASNAFASWFFKWDGGSNNRSYVLEFYITAGEHRSAVLLSSNGGGGAYSNSISLGQTLATDTWYHWVYNYDASAGTLQVYIDGSLAATHNSTPTSIYNGTADLKVGEGQGYFDGARDEIAIWSGQTLSTAEISWLYNSGSGRSYSDLSGGGGVTFTPKVMWFS